ncbi:MAG: hypothetical protein LH481_08015, partial [Burkholderiales bacterium]|nr:hypothetical protein [Burkholderiales bacterium]
THSREVVDDGSSGVSRAKNKNAFVMPVHLRARSAIGWLKISNTSTGANLRAFFLCDVRQYWGLLFGDFLKPFFRSW